MKKGIFCLLIIFICCSNKLEVREIKDGLFIDQTGNFLFATIDNTNYDKPKIKYISKIYLEGNEPAIDIKKVIDTVTFKKITDNYYNDKNHIYVFSKTLDGGVVSSLNKEDSIKFFNSCKIQRK